MITATCHKCGRKFDYVDGMTCSTCLEKAEPMDETMAAIKLSIIYVSLLKDLDATEQHHQRLKLIDDAVEAACAIKNQSKDLQIDDSDRGWSLKETTNATA